MKIGLRTVKTGIAVALGLLAVQLLNLESPFFVTIAALIGMQPTVTDSWKVGRNRILGTVAGTIFGLLTALILPGHFLLAGIGVIILILFMNRVGIPEGIIISCVVFISIFMVTQEDVVAYALSRLLDTVIGISIALLVNYFVFPPKYDRQAMTEIHRDMTAIYLLQNKILGMLLGKEPIAVEEMNGWLDQLLEEMAETKKLADLQEKEDKLNVYGSVRYKEINLVHRMTTDMYQHLKNLASLAEKPLSEDSAKQMETFLEKLYEKLIHAEPAMEKDPLSIPNKMKELKEEVSRVRRAIKSQEVFQRLASEEIIHLMVVAYNVNEIAGKIELITLQQFD